MNWTIKTLLFRSRQMKSLVFSYQARLPHHCMNLHHAFTFFHAPLSLLKVSSNLALRRGFDLRTIYDSPPATNRKGTHERLQPVIHEGRKALVSSNRRWTAHFKYQSHNPYTGASSASQPLRLARIIWQTVTIQARYSCKCYGLSRVDIGGRPR